MAVCAALGAHLLDLPWTTTSDVVNAAIGDELVKDGERAMLWAFAEALKLWLAAHGGGAASSDATARLQELINYYHAHVALFAAIALQKERGKTRCRLDLQYHEPQTRAGFRVVDRRDPRREQLLYVEILADTLTRALGWSPTEIDFVMRDLKTRGLLKAPAGRLQSRRRVGADKPRVYRLMASVFWKANP
jgi:hypothetical protein